jgi:hypothetical protein
LGARQSDDTIRIFVNSKRDPKALLGTCNLVIIKIFWRLMDNPIKIRPVNVDAAPAVAKK